jgi:hypothetical protein
MPELFLYDTHYQVNRPLALLHLTLETASPTRHVTNEALARRLASAAKAGRIMRDGELAPWEVNDDAMLYWLGNCHQANLLSRQNAYDYWLMNFVWGDAFEPTPSYWGQLRTPSQNLTKLLLLRWAWVFDGPMLAATLWKMNELGTADLGALVQNGHVERILEAAFSAARDTTAEPREQIAYRKKLELIRRGLKYNTRRHKVCVHAGILSDTGLIVNGPTPRLHDGAALAVGGFGSAHEAAAAALRQGSLGFGGELFLDVVKRAFLIEPVGTVELGPDSWLRIQEEVSRYWRRIEAWDRKFLGIRALAEFFLVKNLMTRQPIWEPESWPSFFSQRARYHPEELTVHVDRSGRVEFLKLSSAA